ncbi:MAG TPA: hypothetical protein VMR66_03000, partial [Gemmatimonadota bacterium]|nr:hypothetical protein [Gemmatimonadota bacterium]
GKRSRYRPLRDIAFLDPILLPMISTEALDAVSAGGHYTRVEKTLQVAEAADSYDLLDVCVRNDRAGNCSTCKKCVRTLLTLEIAGLTDRYAELFDIDAFHRSRRWWVGRILRSDTQNSEEIVRFARERGYRFRLVERIVALARLDLLRTWAIGQAARLTPVRNWIRRRKVERSPLWSART